MSVFTRFSKYISNIVGSPYSFTVMLSICVIWFIGGLVYFGLNNHLYQLYLNSLSSILCMLIAFLIQNTQNRDTLSIQLKLDELLVVQEQARRKFICLEECSDEEMENLSREFKRLHDQGELSEGCRKNLNPIK
jgi:low affinity Fe/Cu permease